SIVARAQEEHIDFTPLSQVEALAGLGLVAESPEGKILVGSRRMMEEAQVTGLPAETAPYGTEVYVAKAGLLLGKILISDAVRADSAEAIALLHKRGITTSMLTGDRQESADYIAKETGVDNVRAHLLPQDKLSVVQELRQAYGPTMFVGDGINDAPVLAGADVGGAMGSGADAAIEASDVVFMNSSLKSIVHVLRLADDTVKIAWQNVVFAIAVKVLVMIMGILGYANMWWAVFADTGVAMLCILNSIRILYKK
ncbi:MAG: HAD-IC family P-type ATPase, partial [Veillonella sp.]|nr:HAD-IC family P-type ATPase [Veillonella sp.]